MAKQIDPVPRCLTWGGPGRRVPSETLLITRSPLPPPTEDIVMARFVDRRTFLKPRGAAPLGIMGAPRLASSRAAAAGERLVVAVGQWGIETPFAWRTSQF